TRSVSPDSSEDEKDNLDQSYGYKLGRDDPFWPHYLEEAEKYDDMMIQKWDKKMETLLLFATLFSAIVTAFVMESSQNLQPDNAAITATAIVEITRILRNRTMDSPEGSSILDSSDDFQPSANAFIVNFAWFISLCLSITVALLAGLVKQWCNTLLWDRAAPPCNQARIRQARFNGLMYWQIELVIFALPVIMDAALGLFLVGLMAFLQDLNFIIFLASLADLNFIIFLASLAVTLLTATFYFGTTLAPCFFPFCPYETAITSPKVWGFCYQLCLAFILWVAKNFREFDEEVKADLTNYMSPAGKKEKEMADNTTPDDLTGDALNWVILHSQKPEPREMAIRAIATLDSEGALKQLVSNPPGILPQVIQSFTSCFVVNSMERGVLVLEFKRGVNHSIASLYGRALTVLVTQVLLAGSLKSQVQYSEIELGPTHSKWAIDPITKEAVKTRFEHLADINHAETKAWALVGLSVWHDFIGFIGGLRFNQGKTVCQLAGSLDSCNRLSSILRKEVLRTLTKEITYWAPNVSNSFQKDTLRHLINLILDAPPVEQPQLACALAVLALNLNHSTSYPLLPDYPNSQPGVLRENGSGNKFSKLLMSYYVSGPGDLGEDGHSLLLFALTGLMEYYEHCDFNNEAYENMKKIAERFQGFDILGKLQFVNIPVAATGTNFRIKSIDLRAYFVDTLLLYLKLPRTPQHSQDIDGVLTRLLKSINPKRQSWELEEYGPQIVPLATQMLIQTKDIHLQIECLNTVISYWDSGPSLLYSRMQLFYEVPLKLLQVIKNITDLQPYPTLAPTISFIFQKIGEQTRHFNTPKDKQRLALCMDNVMSSDLLEILIDILHISDKPEFLLLRDTYNHPERSAKDKFNPGVQLLQILREYLRLPTREGDNGELLIEKIIEAFDQKTSSEYCFGSLWLPPLGP
ncbi:unnamed protein product, partial [Rhizoctonia solani]